VGVRACHSCPLTEVLTTDLWRYFYSFLSPSDVIKLQRGSKHLHSLFWDQLIRSLTFAGWEGNLSKTGPTSMMVEPHRDANINYFLDKAKSITRLKFGSFDEVLPASLLLHPRLTNLTSFFIETRFLPENILDSLTHLTKLRHLNLEGMDPGVVTPAISGFTNLTSLDMCISPHPSFVFLKAHTNLTHLDLSYSLNPDNFDILYSFPRLTDLNLNRSGTLNDQCVKTLQDLTLLETLLIAYTKCPKQFLSSLTRLKSLTLNPTEEEAVENHLPTLTNLTELNIVGWRIHFRSFHCLETLTNLMKFKTEASFTDLRPRSLDSILGKLTQMTHLDLRDVPDPETLMENLKNLTSLRTLKMRMDVDQGVENFTYLTNLTKLKVQSGGAELFASIPVLSNLTSLNLDWTAPSPHFFESYSILTNLKVLSLQQVTGAHIVHFSHFTRLEKLNLRDCDIDDLKIIRNFKSLVVLKIESKALTEKTLKEDLFGLESLRILHVSSPQLDGQFFENFGSECGIPCLMVLEKDWI